jgi:hypothetical protein
VAQLKAGQGFQQVVGVARRLKNLCHASRIIVQTGRKMNAEKSDHIRRRTPKMAMSGREQ